MLFTGFGVDLSRICVINTLVRTQSSLQVINLAVLHVFGAARELPNSVTT